MVKFTANTDFNFDMAVASIVTDSRSLTKRASARGLLKFEKTAGQTDLHIIALGAYEGTGFNRNGDAFMEDDCRKNHHFFKQANRAVHRHHKNKPTDPKYGNIKAAAYNEDMKRIELVVGLDNDKCSDILDEQEKKGQTQWSMACVLDPQYPVLTDHGYVPIVDVKVGDTVLTHLGRWKRVTELCRSNYTGPVYALSINGLPDFPKLTGNHPLFATRFPALNNLEKQARYFKDPTAFDNNPPEWSTVDTLNVGDRLYYRSIPEFEGVAGIDDPLLAKLLGYYTAEGSINGGAVSLSCNVTDSLPVVIPQLFKERFPDITVSLAPNPNSKVSLCVNIFNTELTRICALYCGKLSHEKRLHPALYNASKESKLAFMGAWLDGDGFTDKKGAHISSCNYTLILQGRDILMSLGIPSSIYKIDHRSCETSGMDNSGFEYTLNISWIDAPQLAGVSQKIDGSVWNTPLDTRKKPACLRVTSDPSLFAYRISDIEVETVENTSIYNFEVEDDHSYILGGVISHNSKQAYDICSWCEHKAKTDKDRCDCIPAKIGELNDQGVMAGMINPNPKWFEISHVGRGADRIGVSLKYATDGRVGRMTTADYLRLYPGFEEPVDEILISKKAADKRALLHKLAEMEKHIDAVAAGESKHSAKDLFIKRQARLKKSKKMAPKEMDELRKHEPGKAMRGMADNGVVLGPEEFTNYAFGDKAKPEVAEGMKTHLPHVFSNLKEKGDGEAVNSEKFEPSELSILPKGLRDLMGQLFEGHSLFGEPSVKRVMRITIELGPKGDDTDLKPKVPTDNKADEKLAEVYASYKLAALQHLQDTGKLTDEVLWNSLIQNR